MLKSLRLPVFCLSMLLLTGLAQEAFAQGDSHKKTLRKAKEHIEFEEYQAAIPVVQKLLESDPRNAYYNYWMGKSLFKTYRKNQALPYLKVVEAENPDIAPDFHWIYGLTLHYNLAFDKALVEYRKDLERHLPASPESIETNNRIAQCMYAINAIPSREATKVVISNLGPSINTEFSEHSPVLTDDNHFMAFTARRPASKGSQPEAGYYDEDVYVARKEGQEWTQSENVGSPVNTKGHDATISISPEGKTMYIYRHLRDGGLFYSKFSDEENKWGKLNSAGKPFNSRDYEASICVNTDSTILFFTSDRPGGFGGLDIYRVRKEGKEWGPAENVGPVINTPQNEDAPYFHRDEKTLYYSSDGPKGYGGYDIFVTEWDSANAVWLEPLNMGAPVNSPDDEIYFVLGSEPKKGFYASGKSGGFGEKDIYEIIFPSFPYPRRFHLLEVAGIVQDVHTLDTLVAWVRLRDGETGLLVDSVRTGPQTGRYSFALEPERAYSLEIMTDGYSEIRETVDAPPVVEEDVVLERNFYVGKTAVPAPPVVEALPEFQHIYFDFDKAELRKRALSDLDRLAEFLQSRPGFSVQVLGHTDWFGTYDYNVELSTRRTQEAVAYLQVKGVDANRIQTAAFSENRPLDPNTNDDGRQYNRRCEFQVIDQQGQVVLSSIKLTANSEAPYVDHTQPRGAAGFDNPATMVSGDVADAPARPAIPVSPNTSTGARPSGDNAPQGGYENPAAPEYMKGLGLTNIYFDYGKDEIKPEFRVQLEQMLKLLREDPEAELLIKGHTDGDGSDVFNQALSERRCNAVSSFFAASAIDPARITSNGHSEHLPIADNNSEVGRQWNRRVEFEIRKGGKVMLRSAP